MVNQVKVAPPIVGAHVFWPSNIEKCPSVRCIFDSSTGNARNGYGGYKKAQVDELSRRPRKPRPHYDQTAKEKNKQSDVHKNHTLLIEPQPWMVPKNDMS
jgi:hypothetical protein